MVMFYDAFYCNISQILASACVAPLTSPSMLSVTVDFKNDFNGKALSAMITLQPNAECSMSIRKHKATGKTMS